MAVRRPSSLLSEHSLVLPEQMHCAHVSSTWGTSSADLPVLKNPSAHWSHFCPPKGPLHGQFPVTGSHALLRLPTASQSHDWHPASGAVVRLKKPGKHPPLQARPATPSGHGHCPVVTLQVREVENCGKHVQGRQPAEVKLKWSGRQSAQVGPPTPGLQLHWPESEQIGDREPTRSQSHAEEKREFLNTCQPQKVAAMG